MSHLQNKWQKIFHLLWELFFSVPGLCHILFPLFICPDHMRVFETCSNQAKQTGLDYWIRLSWQAFSDSIFVQRFCLYLIHSLVRWFKFLWSERVIQTKWRTDLSECIKLSQSWCMSTFHWQVEPLHNWGSWKTWSISIQEHPQLH